MSPRRRRRRSSSFSSSSSYSRSRSRSSSAGPHPRNAPRNHHHQQKPPRLHKPSFKTAAVLVAAIAVATICVHRVWTRRRSHRETDQHHQRWEDTPGRRSVRQNVVRDRHNGYIDDRSYGRSTRPRLSVREYYHRASRSGGGGASRFYYDAESDGEGSYYSDYCPSPSRMHFSRSRIGDRRGRRLAEEEDEELVEVGENVVPVFAGPRDEVVRYEKVPTVRSGVDSNQRLFDEDIRSRRRVEDAVRDWSRRGSKRFPSPVDDRRSRRRFENY